MVSTPTRATSTPSTISREAVLALSHAKSEPAWLREQRLAAWDAFERIPMPTRKMEEWRRTDIRELDVGAFAPFDATTHHAASLKELPAPLRAVAGKGVVGRRADADGGLLVQRDSDSSFERLSDDLARRGVIFTSLDRAVRDYSELVRERLMTRVVTPETDKFTALHAALWSGGAFVYVPRGVEVALPLRSILWLSRARLGVFGHTLLVAEPWSQVTYLDEYLSAPLEGGQGLHAGVVEILAGEGSQVRYLHLQQFGEDVWNFTTERALIERDATVSVVQVGLGSRLTKANVQAVLAGPGSNAELLGVYYVGGAQHLDHHTLQEHRAPHTSSDLLYKGATGDRAHSVYSGLIRVDPIAQKTDAYQANRNLLLSGDARADSIPQLEILASDVRCTHGATVGPIDAEEVFYLGARGIPRPEAERLIVEGFFQPVVERIPLPTVRERINRAIATKYAGTAS